MNHSTPKRMAGFNDARLINLRSRYRSRRRSSDDIRKRAPIPLQLLQCIKDAR